MATSQQGKGEVVEQKRRREKLQMEKVSEEMTAERLRYGIRVPMGLPASV
jgi:hypothetical protein